MKLTPVASAARWSACASRTGSPPLVAATSIAAGVTGNVGLRVDFARNITLDLSFSVCPGIHLRTNKSTGALITSFYKGGLYRAYFPQLNLFYRF